jgi:putative endonuclease
MAWTWLRKLAGNPTAGMALGERGEKFAARHLRRHGYKILVRRFQGRSGEIDIICRQDDVLVFVEVKTRASDQRGRPSEFVDRNKQRNLSKTALDYLRLLENPQIKFRFDIVEVILPAGARRPTEIRVIPNAFELTEPYHY